MPEELFQRVLAPAGDPNDAPQILLVFAHPDDETLALGARLSRARHSITVTDGAPRDGRDSRAHGFGSIDEYRDARRHELRTALEAAAFRGRADCFEIPDQEAALHLPEVARRIFDTFERERPEAVFTHPYEGGHPDHDACAFAVSRAAAMARARSGSAPLVIETPFYHAGPKGWETEEFPPSPSREFTFELSPGERALKQALLDSFASQRETLLNFPLACERFRIAPVYDFYAVPHAGRVLYETFGWTMNSERFCQLAREADAALGTETASTCV